MLCHLCGKTVQPEDRFCTGCGAALHEGTEPTAVVEPVSPDTDTEPEPGTESGPDLQPDAEPGTNTEPDTDTDTKPDSRPDPQPDPDTQSDAEPDPAADRQRSPDNDAIADEPTELVPAMRRRGATPTTPIAPSVPAPAAEQVDAGARPPTADTTQHEPTAVSSDTEGDDAWSADDPVWASTGALPTQQVPEQADTGQVRSGPRGDGAAPPASGFTADMPATQPITEVWMDAVDQAPEPPAATPYDFAEHQQPTDIAPAVLPNATAQMPAVMAHDRPGPRFRLGAVTVIAVMTGVVTLISLFAEMISVTSDQRLTPSEQTPFGFRTGTWIADDLADNLSIAGLVAIMLMVAGGVATGFHWRWGAGLAGGAGLAVAGLAAITIGLAQFPIDAAHEFVLIPTDQQFTLTITRGLGYWLTVAAAALGVVLFFAAINDASGDRRSGLNPWIAALGALATVVAAAGPLLPEQQAVFSDNWYLIEAAGEPPAMMLVGRLVQLGLLLMAGVVGFLTVRRWGLGLAIGGSLPVIWLAASTLFELTDRPVGPGFRNPGATTMHIHGVTIIGVSAVAAMAVLAVIAAYDQAVRERP